jgi:hypothetical protein
VIKQRTSSGSHWDILCFFYVTEKAKENNMATAENSRFAEISEEFS